MERILSIYHLKMVEKSHQNKLFICHCSSLLFTCLFVYTLTSVTYI